VAAVAIVTVADFFLLLEEVLTELVAVGACAPRPVTGLPAVANTTGVGEGATEFGARVDAAPGAGIAPVECGGNEAVGSATGGKADMLGNAVLIAL